VPRDEQFLDATVAPMLTVSRLTHLLTERPLGARVGAALGHALSGDIGRAAAEVHAAATAPEPRRPDHLLRNVRSQMLVPVYGALNDGMRAQLKTSNLRSGDLGELRPDTDVDRYMKGDLG
jgi:hypothetical protein